MSNFSKLIHQLHDDIEKARGRASASLSKVNDKIRAEEQEIAHSRLAQRLEAASKKAALEVEEVVSSLTSKAEVQLTPSVPVSNPKPADTPPVSRVVPVENK